MEDTAPVPVPEPDPSPAPKRRFRIRLWMVAVLAGMLITGACVGSIAYGVLQGLDEADESKRELTLFLQRISANDTTAAYEQFSREAKAEVRPADFAQAPRQRQFQDFEKLSTDAISRPAPTRP